MAGKYELKDLTDIIRRLRGENGCPWDRVQTHESLREAMLEEAYETVDAIDKGDMKNLKEELGDVLLQVVFHTELAREKGIFEIEDVIEGICKKMIYRHPHVFGDTRADTADEVLQNWEELKKQEKHFDTQTEIMKKIPDALPALTKAKKIQKKAADAGFDFYDVDSAIDKVREELDELEEAIRQNLGTEDEEFGDILFSMVNISRFLKINPEFSLTKGCKKFINRFEYVENSALNRGKSISDMTLEELNSLWDEAKESLTDCI